eukprot:gene20365-biopygen1039
MHFVLQCTAARRNPTTVELCHMIDGRKHPQLSRGEFCTWPNYNWHRPMSTSEMAHIPAWEGWLPHHLFVKDTPPQRDGKCASRGKISSVGSNLID